MLNPEPLEDKRAVMFGEMKGKEKRKAMQGQKGKKNWV